MKLKYIIILLTCAIFSCGTLKKSPSPETIVPSIGVVGKKNNSILHTNFYEVGVPKLTEKIAISVKTIPFNKVSYKNYQNLKIQRNQQISLRYFDSVLIKPKYLYFEIKDKIGLRTILNNEENKELRRYLVKDKACQIVSGISMYLDEMEADMFERAQTLFLVSDNDGRLRIELDDGIQKQRVRVIKDEIFEYDLMWFCWGETKYGKPQIETFSNGKKCPDGTFKNAQKATKLLSF